MMGVETQEQGPLPCPAHVAILGMGASNGAWSQIAGSNGHPRAVCDEVWVINGAAAVFHHDRAFVMDDVKHEISDQASREGKAERKVAKGILKWLPSHPGPVYSTTAYPEWPALVEYPTADVIETIGTPYINNSVAYAVAYAIHCGVKMITLFGCDFNYPDGNPVAEHGRGCVEFLLGIAVARGIEVQVPDNTTLMDGHVPMNKKLYGFHEPAIPSRGEDGKLVILRGAEIKEAAEKAKAQTPAPAPTPDPVLVEEAA